MNALDKEIYNQLCIKAQDIVNNPHCTLKSDGTPQFPKEYMKLTEQLRSISRQCIKLKTKTNK